MSNILICVFPAPGHVNPMLAVAAHLKNVGHQIVFNTGEVFGDRIEALDIPFAPMNDYLDRILASCGVVKKLTRPCLDACSLLPDRFFQFTAAAFEFLRSDLPDKIEFVGSIDRRFLKLASPVDALRHYRLQLS
jgi:UDP:flavonoid glycosyltransferase YjiC (YdhE family)